MHRCSSAFSTGALPDGRVEHCPVILFGHPTGNPNSHHAALAHYEAGHLEAFCVPWMPTPLELNLLRALPGTGPLVSRLRRRSFEPLLRAPRIEDRTGEWLRIVRRLASTGIEEKLAYEANDWLMRTMAGACRKTGVTAVHSYEDCSLTQFEEAARLGKARIYDMPTVCYPAWVQTRDCLVRRYADWLAPSSTPLADLARPEQKRRELELADVVLVPTAFVRRTVLEQRDVKTVLAPYGVDTDYWRPAATVRSDRPLTFIYAGRCSARKGIPLLLEAWASAHLDDAQLLLVGTWDLAPQRLKMLPNGVRHIGPTSSAGLREHYHSADVFVFPSFSEGFGLVLLEAMACGMPAIASDATAGPEVLDDRSGRIVPAGDLDALIDALRWFGRHQDRIPDMRRASRAAAERCTWARYRAAVSAASAEFC
jgi:glycosyltransferase involved in cell wall biosynthesis